MRVSTSMLGAPPERNKVESKDLLSTSFLIQGWATTRALSSALLLLASLALPPNPLLGQDPPSGKPPLVRPGNAVSLSSPDFEKLVLRRAPVVTPGTRSHLELRGVVTAQVCIDRKEKSQPSKF